MRVPRNPQVHADRRLEINLAANSHGPLSGIEIRNPRINSQAGNEAFEARCVERACRVILLYEIS